MQSPTPPGAVFDGTGVTFSLFSENATAVDLCLFERPEDTVTACASPLRREKGGLWRVSIPGLEPGRLYGYRVHGPFEPQNGHRFNPAKLLVDPWARAITGEPANDPALLGYSDPARPDLSYNGCDSTAAMPKCVVVDPAFDWGGDRAPRTPWRDTVIYECHVRGMTRLHPQVEPALRGTYLGLAQPPVVEHLQSLGVTAVELLPVFQIARERHLMAAGMPNYWGYSPLGFFAPHAGYATGCRGEQVVEFKTMVRELHRAGIEVILDVVYNHTAEGDHRGPTLAFRGLDNRTFYRLRQRNRRRYVDYSGCGNVLDLARPAVRDFVLANLRYWVEEMHVDGFRFDLAPALGRDNGRFDPECELFARIAADPVLSRVKLIAEPWDLGEGGYQLGRFPPQWAEWNDRFRDAARRFWRGDPGTAGELAVRQAGSRDLFAGKGPLASVNFVTCHDGFTLRDLVSYKHKHNEANGESNHDGHGHNLSRNWGAEGPSDDPGIRQARSRARRSLLATVLLSRGVPMLLAGDELGRTQQGNNNAYCQDNELSWIDWTSAPEDADFLDFVRRLTALRRRFPSLRAAEPQKLVWWRPDGREMEPDDWEAFQAFGVEIRAAEAESDLVLLFNGAAAEVVFEPPLNGLWTELLDTARPEPAAEASAPFVLAGHSLRVLLRNS